MYGVDVLDIYGNPVEHLTQWDVDQRLQIKIYSDDLGLLTIRPNVHFVNSTSKEALVVRSSILDKKTIVVDVPNSLLEEPYAITGYVYLTDRSILSSQKTIVKFELPVVKRQRPSDYEYVENIERITAEKIKFEIADEISDGYLKLFSYTLIDVNTGRRHKVYAHDEKLMLNVNSYYGDDEEVYAILDTRDKDELVEKIDSFDDRINDAHKKLKEKVNISDIINNLETNDSKKPLSAAMGVKLKKHAIDVSNETAKTKVLAHNVSPDAHEDIRTLLTELTDRFNALANSDDENLNQLSEIVAYIKENKKMINKLVSGKVNVEDVVNNLITKNTTKPLSAAMGVELKRLINDMSAVIAAHGADADSHTDIRDAVGAARKRAEEAYNVAMAGGGEAALGIEAHDADVTAHQDIRTLVSKAQADATSALNKIEEGTKSNLEAGTGIEIANNEIRLKVATTNEVGGVKAGDNVFIDKDGTISTEVGGFMDNESFIDVLTSYHTRYHR